LLEAYVSLTFENIISADGDESLGSIGSIDEALSGASFDCFDECPKAIYIVKGKSI
jgi:hypothetical protein